MEASYMLWLVYVSLASCVLYKLFLVGSKSSRLPPGPTPIPLLGNIFDIQGDLHQALTRLAGVHGPIISIKLGATTAVVASSAACARDVLQKYDHLLAARSVADAARALGNHEHSIIWLPSSSPLWKRLRAVCTNHLFSAHALDAARAVREEKVRGLVGCIRGHAGETVEVGRVVLSGLFNIVSSVLFSEEVGDLSSDRAQGLETLTNDLLMELIKPNMSDLFPVLSVLDLQGRRRRTVEHLRRFFDFFDPIIERRMKAGGERQGDFLDVLLQLHSVDQLSIQTIKSFLLDLFIAGTETNALTVEWTMAELLRHPAVMSKVRAELQGVVGAKQYPDESDISRLPYLQAVLMESMRLHPPSPLLIPHQAMVEGAEVGGFVVPKGAMVIVNLWAVMRDPATWTHPEEFMPERFVGADMDFRGKDRFEFMPFGAGRRACPGMPMATRVVTLILASLLHRFEWRLPEGMQPCDVDVRDRYRMSLNMVTPIKAVPLPLFS
ncbi:cytochrome P450 76M5-like [Triticum urartu]|uniref:Cytochrome P450 76C4 n=1 Tax=Triticum urartu TaxID=4572 RepID=A0A8R7QGY3_TRIUA|nr:cytochrome P450 76M5-like [Triticum urartu]